mmetsp:Transcript_131662/g.328310  ORF Transcript_131662/g.328310 Transcript_131662/m.328310 type:complete len:277 (+) Transcript_131662:445-1275(+)
MMSNTLILALPAREATTTDVLKVLVLGLHLRVGRDGGADHVAATDRLAPRPVLRRVPQPRAYPARVQLRGHPKRLQAVALQQVNERGTVHIVFAHGFCVLAQVQVLEVGRDLLDGPLSRLERGIDGGWEEVDCGPAAIELLVHERKGVEGELALHGLADLPMLDGVAAGFRPRDLIDGQRHGEEHGHKARPVAPPESFEAPECQGEGPVRDDDADDHEARAAARGERVETTTDAGGVLFRSPSHAIDLPLSGVSDEDDRVDRQSNTEHSASQAVEE